MELQRIVFVLGFCVLCCHGDYTCLCNYNVEIPVYTSPDIATPVLGYMYEFDCKNLLSEVDPEWPAIEFEHQLGYVETNGQVKIQTCPGSVPDADRIASTTISSTSVFTSTLTSSPKATMSSKTSLKVTTNLHPMTTSSPNTTTTDLPSTTPLPSSANLPSNITINPTTNLSQTTFLLFNKTLSSTTNIPQNATLTSTTTFLPTAHFNTSLSSLTFSVLNSSSYEKSTQSNVVTGASGQNTSSSYNVSSHIYKSTSSLNSMKYINTSINAITSPQISTSSPVMLTTNNLHVNSTFTTEISSGISSLSTNHTLNTSLTTYSSNYSLSTSTTPSISTPYFTNQSSLNRSSLPPILSTQMNISEMKSSSTLGWTTSNLTQTSSNLTTSDRTSSISTSKFTTKKTSSTPSIYTSVWKTTQVSTTSEPLIVSSYTSGNSGSTEKPIVSDRVDLCPYKNLAMSMYNRTLNTYPLFRQYGNYCYELRLKLGNWFEAQQDCVSRGGELAVIQNKEVQERVFNLTSSTKYKVDSWIGLHDLNQEGHWEWVNGAKLSKSSFNKGVLIIPAFTDSQDCVLMDAKSGVWKNTACESILFDIQSYPWICQYKMA